MIYQPEIAPRPSMLTTVPFSTELITSYCGPGPCQQSVSLATIGLCGAPAVSAGGRVAGAAAVGGAPKPWALAVCTARVCMAAMVAPYASAPAVGVGTAP